MIAVKDRASGGTDIITRGLNKLFTSTCTESRYRLVRSTGTGLGSRGGSEGAYSPLVHLYSIRGRKKLDRYVASFPRLTPFLIEARNVAQGYFPDARFELAIKSDHEDEGDQLYIYIFTKLSVEEAIQRLGELERDWYLEAGKALDWRFNFNIRFD